MTIEYTTIPDIFRHRLNFSPALPAYTQYNEKNKTWETLTWNEMSQKVAIWQQSMLQENLQPGDKVAIWLKNSIEWVLIDQAALALGLVIVPLYVDDRPDNCAYIIEHADVKLLILGDMEQWVSISRHANDLSEVKRFICIDGEPVKDNDRFVPTNLWLRLESNSAYSCVDIKPDDLATIVYTSGTTGKPKGVMLSHRNICWNACACLIHCPADTTDHFLSFLPLSHMFERTVGYYAAMLAGAQVTYTRSVSQLAEDLLIVKPTMLISVPRIFERVYAKIQSQLESRSRFSRHLFSLAVDTGWQYFEYQQGRSRWSPRFLLLPVLDKLVNRKVMHKLGGRIRVAISGGAALSSDIARFFIGLGLPIIQGYGLTETSPVITANTLSNNKPASVGTPLKDVVVKTGEKNELLIKSPGVMKGYWKNSVATNQVIDQDGWLHTGDKSSIDEDGYVFITGRIKEIIVLANGEKIPPADMEMAISLDSLFDQVFVLGESRPYLSAICVISQDKWSEIKKSKGFHKMDSPDSEEAAAYLLNRVNERLHDFPGYAKIRKLTVTSKPWTVESGLITPTLKIRRHKVLESFSEEIDKMYQGH